MGSPLKEERSEQKMMAVRLKRREVGSCRTVAWRCLMKKRILKLLTLSFEKRKIS